MISLLVPTRNRPDGVRRMWESALATADGDIEACFYVDDDDPAGDRHLWDLPGVTRIRVGPRVVLSEAWNKAYEMATGDLLMHASDDIVFRTNGWDTAVRRAFDRYPDRIVFVHGEDGFQHDRIGTHGFLHRRWVDTLGYFVPPYFSSDYNDLWLTEVADVIGRRVFLPDVVTEHMHPCAGKGELDQTHRERLERHARDNPERLYQRLADRRAADANLLLAVIRSDASDSAGISPTAASDGPAAVETPPERENGAQRPRWSILVATVGVRNTHLAHLLDLLAPQVDAADGQVEVVVHWDNFETTLGQCRQALLDDARGDWVSFIDDDDEVPPYHVERVLAALDEDPDYVGWRQQLYVDGRPTKPTFHSLRYDRWWEDDAGYYRHVSHLNPIRTRIARLERFDRVRPGTAEDATWAERVHRHLARCVNVREVFIDDVMYRYLWVPDESLWSEPHEPGGAFPRPVLPSRWMRFHPGSAVGADPEAVPA